MILENRYVIAVRDLNVSAAFYRDALGFEIRLLDDPGWQFFLRDGCMVMAGECRDERPAADIGNHSYFAYLQVDAIDADFARARDAGAEFIKPLRDEPWGMREFGLRTPDGHRIMFGQEIPPS